MSSWRLALRFSVSDPTSVQRMNLLLAALEDLLQGLDPVRLRRRLVPANAADPGKAHGDAGFVPGGALQALEGDFENEPAILAVFHLPDGPEAVDRVVADVAVELQQLLVR